MCIVCGYIYPLCEKGVIVKHWRKTAFLHSLKSRRERGREIGIKRERGIKRKRVIQRERERERERERYKERIRQSQRDSEAQSLHALHAHMLFPVS